MRMKTQELIQRLTEKPMTLTEIAKEFDVKHPHACIRYLRKQGCVVETERIAYVQYKIVGRIEKIKEVRSRITEYKNSIHRIVDDAGGAREFAQALGISYQYVYAWVNSNRVPVKWVPVIMKHLKSIGVDAKPEELRPGFDWSPIRERVAK